jgi:hypothetical protein
MELPQCLAIPPPNVTKDLRVIWVLPIRLMKMYSWFFSYYKTNSNQINEDQVHTSKLINHIKNKWIIWIKPTRPINISSNKTFTWNLWMYETSIIRGMKIGSTFGQHFQVNVQFKNLWPSYTWAGFCNLFNNSYLKCHCLVISKTCWTCIKNFIFFLWFCSKLSSS